MTVVDLVTTGIVVLSSVYTGLKVPVLRRQYRGRYGRLLVGLSLVSVLFGLAHVGALVSVPRVVLAVTETSAELGVLVVVAVFGFVHPRVRYAGGERP